MFVRSNVLGKFYSKPENEEGAAADLEEDAVVDEGADAEEDTSEAEETESNSEDENEGAEPQSEEDGDESETSGEETQPNRRTSRLQRLANQAREEREARIRAEGERDALRNNTRTSTTHDPDTAARVRKEKLDLMTPEERKEFLRDEEVAMLKHGMQMIQLQTADATDKATFESSTVRNPVRAKYLPRIETQLAEFRRNGANPSREAVFHYLLGKDVDTAPVKATNKQKRAAADRVNASKGAPLPGRSDSTTKRAGKGDSLADLEARLKGKEI